MPQKAKLFKLLLFFRLRMLAVGNREGSEERVQEGAEGTLFIVGRTKEEEGLSKEGGTKCFRIA